MTGRVLVTGHAGYIGTVLVPMLQEAGFDVVGLDTGLFDHHAPFVEQPTVAAIHLDIRDVRSEHLQGFDAIVHLAAISNDPMGSLRPDVTYEINHRATVRLARLAKAAGVVRFLFSSSCSLYGAAAPESFVDETADFNPVTPYGHAKVLAELEVGRLADDDFSPTFLRNATAYGVSPRLRADLVVNNLVGIAAATGVIQLESDGTPWRPLVHVEDIAAAFLAVLEAPRALVHNEAFNVGRTAENYRIRDVARIVNELMPDCELRIPETAGPDARTYRVDCDKIDARLAGFRPRWTVRRGAEQLLEHLQRSPLTLDEFLGPRFVRLRRVRQLLDAGRLDDSLRWSDTRDSSDGDLVLAG